MDEGHSVESFTALDYTNSMYLCVLCRGDMNRIYKVPTFLLM